MAPRGLSAEELIHPPREETTTAEMMEGENNDKEDNSQGGGDGSQDNNKENANMEHSSRRQHRNNNKKRRKLAVFGDSGLTDAERRALRQEQRAIASKLRDTTNEEQLMNERQRNNALFQTKVCYTREAVLDADNVDLIATNLAQQVEQQTQVPRYDPLKLVQKLSNKCTTTRDGSSFFDWAALGNECGVCFNALPEEVSFLAGILDSTMEVKQRAARRPREKVVEDESKHIRPEQVQKSSSKDDDAADKLSAAEKNMKALQRKLKQRCKEEMEATGSPQIDGMKFLINPKSFTQTVENMFMYGFLVKKGEGGIGIDDQKGLFVVKTNKKEEDQATQAVCSFTMRDWRRLIAAYQLEEGDLPHRTGSKHSRKHNNMSQTAMSQTMSQS